MRTVLAQLKQYKKASFLTMGFTTLEVIMEVLLPFVTAMIIDEGLQKADLSTIIQLGILMVIMAAISLLSGAMAGKYSANASSGFACNLRESMYTCIQEYSFSNIDKFSTAGLVTRMTTDVTNIQNAFQMIIRVAVRAPLMLIFSMIMCILINRQLSLIFFLALCFLAIVLLCIMRKASKLFREVFDRYDDLNASVQENVTAIRVVKAYVRENFENTKFQKAAKHLYNLFVKAESLLAFNNPVMMLAVYACITFVSWFGAQFIVAGSMTTGEITSLFSYIMSIMMSLMMLSMIFVMITMSAASVQRISEVLKEQPDLCDPKEPVQQIKDGSIDFDHVSFAYKQGSGEDTLEDIDLHIRSGETIGIIGGTGCGKSSLVNLISRLYDVTKGCVRVGGLDVRQYDMEVLRNEVAVVLQKNVLFSGTILDNLRWGNEDATEEECIRACEAACADEFIEQMPNKYETWIERGGTNVSGGQKQRLCIARALLKKPKILILDDSTSAVDTATDAKIRQAFQTYIPGTTKIIIAQRVSSVEDADRIIVMDNGKINGVGTHEELIQNNEIYRDIYESQLQGGGDFDQNGQ